MKLRRKAKPTADGSSPPSAAAKDADMPDQQQNTGAPDTETREPSDQEYIAGLGDDRARQLFQKMLSSLTDAQSDLANAHHEAAARRHELEELKRAQETDTERHDREIEERVRAQAEAEHQQERDAWHRERIRDRVQLRAGVVGFQDPDDADKYVDLAALADAKDLDTAIDKQLADVLERKKHLARNGAQRQPLVSQGARSQEPTGRTDDRRWLHR